MDNREIIRQAIRNELIRRGWTIYRLVKVMGQDGIRLQTAIYGWLGGRRHITDTTASLIMHTLELEIV